MQCGLLTYIDQEKGIFCYSDADNQEVDEELYGQTFAKPDTKVRMEIDL